MKENDVVAIKMPRKKLALSPEEKKRLADYFSMLIEIDQRNKRENNEAKII